MGGVFRLLLCVRCRVRGLSCSHAGTWIYFLYKHTIHLLLLVIFFFFAIFISLLVSVILLTSLSLLLSVKSYDGRSVHTETLDPYVRLPKILHAPPFMLLYEKTSGCWTTSPLTKLDFTAIQFWFLFCFELIYDTPETLTASRYR